MKRVLTLVGILALVQLGLFGVYELFERDAKPNRLRRMRRRSPKLVYETRDGRRHELSQLRGPVLLHFWATWCAPCRKELPALLEYATESELSVLAVTVDPTWPPVVEFLGGKQPSEVVRAVSDAPEAFDVQTLPVTFVVTANGRLTARLDGAQDWSSDSVRSAVTALGRDPTASRGAGRSRGRAGRRR